MSTSPTRLDWNSPNTILWDFSRRINSVRILTGVGIEEGMTLQEILAGSGIEAEALQNPLTEIKADQELRVIRNLLGGCHHVPGLGLMAGMRYHATAYDELGYAFISCESLREIFKLAQRFFALSFNFTELRPELGEDTLTLTMDESGIPADVQQFLLERDMAAIVVCARDLFPTNPLPLTAVHLKFPRPTYGDMFDRLFGIAPLFEQISNGMTMPKRNLDAQPMQANPVTVRMCVALCEMRLDQRATTSHARSVAARVRARLRAGDGRFADMERIATEFGMTSRTLRRHLEAEGTTFRTMLDEVREIMADTLFMRGDITVEEVAGRLGYSESSSFTSAFKRWKGVSPRKFHRGRVASGGRATYTESMISTVS